MIRAAQLGDVPGMMELECASETAAHWPFEAYERAIRGEEPRRLTLVAEESGVICGMLMAMCQTSEWELENIAVAADSRRRGLGRTLLDQLLRQAEDSGAEFVFLEVRESNQPARRLYEGAGFVRVGGRKSYYRKPLEDAAVYLKKLGGATRENCC